MAVDSNVINVSNAQISCNNSSITTDSVEEGWMKAYWRPAMAFVYMAICIFDFIVMPTYTERNNIKPERAVELVRTLPEKDQVMALQVLTKESVWNPITLKEGGFIHIAFGFILGISAWTRGQVQIASVKQQ